MKASVRWMKNVAFKGVSETGHEIMMDGPASHGGENKGMRPMELLLLGMGGCSAFDVISILSKARQQVEDCVVDIQAERADTEPKVFVAIHAHFIVTGKDLSEAKVARAIELSAEKYCSASIMLAKTAKITHDYKIIES
ncbi:Protein YhfA [hydrothermal vent metagenome]|uniref:Protein YhfA n=1 Tax=hydrothermal vent metagenome TaxID=652676 RepID=A0A3B0Y325_9ZZZZ